jgi:hypothetical protein
VANQIPISIKIKRLLLAGRVFILLGFFLSTSRCELLYVSYICIKQFTILFGLEV